MSVSNFLFLLFNQNRWNFHVLLGLTTKKTYNEEKEKKKETSIEF